MGQTTRAARSMCPGRGAVVDKVLDLIVDKDVVNA